MIIKDCVFNPRHVVYAQKRGNKIAIKFGTGEIWELHFDSDTEIAAHLKTIDREIQKVESLPITVKIIP